MSNTCCWGVKGMLIVKLRKTWQFLQWTIKFRRTRWCYSYNVFILPLPWQRTRHMLTVIRLCCHTCWLLLFVRCDATFRGQSCVINQELGWKCKSIIRYDYITSDTREMTSPASSHGYAHNSWMTRRDFFCYIFPSAWSVCNKKYFYTPYWISIYSAREFKSYSPLSLALTV